GNFAVLHATYRRRVRRRPAVPECISPAWNRQCGLLRSCVLSILASAPRIAPPMVASQRKKTAAIRVGVGGWVFAPWRGTFYPKKLGQARAPENASPALAPIETNRPLSCPQ